jgi:hypothetical protein
VLALVGAPAAAVVVGTLGLLFELLLFFGDATG